MTELYILSFALLVNVFEVTTEVAVPMVMENTRRRVIVALISCPRIVLIFVIFPVSIINFLNIVLISTLVILLVVLALVFNINPPLYPV